MVIHREAARLILLNNAKDVLLLLHTIGYEQPFWATPGGGLDLNETVEQAARREAKEELGIEQIELTQLWTGQANYIYQGKNVNQTETFFLGHNYLEIFSSNVEEAHRLEGITEVRWWSVSELEETDQVIFPVDLATRLKGLDN